LGNSGPSLSQGMACLLGSQLFTISPISFKNIEKLISFSGVERENSTKPPVFMK